MYAKSSHDLPAFKRFYQLLVASSYVIIFKPQHRVLSLKHSCRLTSILAMCKRSHSNRGDLLFLIYHILYYILYRPLLFITPRANILQGCLKLSWHQQCTISNTSPQRAKLLLIQPARAGPKGLCAESARAFAGRRNSRSGRGEDFLTGQLNFFTETALTLERKVEKWFPRWEIKRHAEG